MSTMHKHPRTLLVIVAEAALEKPLVREVRQHGAQFWTVTEVHGAGLEGVGLDGGEGGEGGAVRVVVLFV